MVKRALTESSKEEGEAPPQRSREGASRANILVTGTPGTGKSETARAIAAALAMEHLSVSELAKEVGALDGWDEARQCHILDEDALLDAMEGKVGRRGGFVVEYHACDFFPERWFDLVLVLRASTENVFDRLQRRGYAREKIQENIHCEVTDLLLQEARDSYAEELVVELANNTPEDLRANLQRVVAWHQANNYPE